MAVPGYTSTQGRAWLEREVDRLRPDFITASFGWNDATLTLVPDREVFTEDRSAYFVRWLIDHSQVFAHLIKWMRSSDAKTNPAVARAQRPTQSRTSTEEYLQNMTAIAKAAENRRIPYLIMAAPFRDREENGEDAQRMLVNRLALGQLMRETETPYLELHELTEDAFPSNDRFFGERIHPSFLGQRLIASELVKAIGARRVLGDLNIPPMTP